MPSRPAWTGEIRIGLVSCAASLHPAVTRAEKIRYNYLNAETGNRLRQQYVDEVTGEVVPPEERVRGYQGSDGGHVMLTEAELDAVELAGSRVVEIVRFVALEEVDRIYCEHPFFVLPDDDDAAEAFAVIRDAMARAGVAGLGSLTIYRREHPVLIEPRGRGLIATTLRYPEEIRGDAPPLGALAERPAPADMVRLAGTLVRALEGPFAPDSFEDRHRAALLDLIEAKRTGAQWLLPGSSGDRAGRLSLADALRRSEARAAAPSRPPGRRDARLTAAPGARGLQAPAHRPRGVS